MSTLAEVLSTKGAHLKLGTTEIVWAYQYAAMGGEPERIDVTPFSKAKRQYKAGVEDVELWNFHYYMNEDDFSAIDTLKTNGTSTAVSITFDDGTVAANSGVVRSNYAEGGEINSGVPMVAALELTSDDWTWTFGS